MIGWAAAGAGLAGLGLSARYHWWRPRQPGVPVLMYHQITAELAGTPLPKLRVTPARFAAQLDALARRGYRTLTLAQAVAAQSAGDDAPAVVLTFDDGFLDFYTQAWPLMRARGMVATVFLVTGLIGQDNRWDREKGLPREPLLDAAQIRELAAAGIEFGGHTHSHVDLTRLDDAALAAELGQCQAALAELLGAPAPSFSYPFGLHDLRVARAVAAAGFAQACTTRPGHLTPQTNPLAIPRIMIKRSDDPLDFSLKLTRARSRW